jgi:hypothetical protein
MAGHLRCGSLPLLAGGCNGLGGSIGGAIRNLLIGSFHLPYRSGPFYTSGFIRVHPVTHDPLRQPLKNDRHAM